jgi:DNA-nicking Smr family endonuclease
MTRRHPRILTREERDLWRHVLRSVQPLSGRSSFVPEDAKPVEDQHVSNAPAPAITQPLSASRPNTKPPKSLPQSPPLVPIETKMLRHLRRGQRPIDGVLDLHGMRQDAAHTALHAFLNRMQMQGAVLVIVVTGKGGGASSRDGTQERGVLRRMVPHWLRLPDLRPIVLGFEPAADRHGGDGALYVRLRRRGPD